MLWLRYRAEHRGTKEKWERLKEMFLPKMVCAYLPWPHHCQVLVRAEGFNPERSGPKVTWAEGAQTQWEWEKGKLCSCSSVMIGYQNPWGIKEGIREGRTWSRSSKRQETPACLFTCSINRGFSSEEQRYVLFPLISRLPNQRWQRAHSDVVTSELWFMPLLGTLHLCLLPFLDLSHKSQGYKLWEIRSR